MKKMTILFKILHFYENDHWNVFKKNGFASKGIRYNNQASMIIENKPLPKPDLRTSVDLSENSSESSFSDEETSNSSSGDEEQLDQGDHCFS